MKKNIYGSIFFPAILCRRPEQICFEDKGMRRC